MYCASFCWISAPTWSVVRPPAATSPTNGTVTLPSGLTGTLTLRSGLCQTVTCSWSSTPIRYDSTAGLAASIFGGADVIPPVAHAVNMTVANSVAMRFQRFMMTPAPVTSLGRYRRVDRGPRPFQQPAYAIRPTRRSLRSAPCLSPRETRRPWLSEAADIVGRLTHPAVQGLLLALLSTALVLWRRPRTAALVAALALAWIWIASTPALALHLRDGLATVPGSSTPHADAIVVLGGGKLPVSDWSRTTTRAGRGLTLWRDGFAPLLLVSGSDQADDLARGFTLSGVPGADLRVENSSVNTHENARNSASILRASGLSAVLLVTS